MLFQLLKIIAQGVMIEFFTNLFQNYLSEIGTVRLRIEVHKFVYSLKFLFFKPIIDKLILVHYLIVYT